MKKIVSLITMAAMLAVSTPAMAKHRNHDHRRDRGVSTEGAIAIGIGALIVGSVIADRNNRRRNSEVIVVDRYPQQPRQVCQDVVQRDYYGNPYVAGRNCWYER